MKPASFGIVRILVLAVLCGVMCAVFVPFRQISEQLSRDPACKIEREIVFRELDGKDLKLDLARPADGPGPFPVLVFVHGGGWRYEGNGFIDELPQAARRGYAAVRIHYRLLDVQKDGHARNPFPAQVEDVLASLDWLCSHADEYQLDTNRIGLAGMSAGGHLALLTALGEYPGHHTQGIKGVVNFYGPTDLLTAYQNRPDGRPLIKVLLDGTPDEVPEKYRAASPVNFLRKDGPPILTLHGAEDPTVPLNQARLLDSKARELGAQHELVVIQGEAHGFSGEASRQAQAKMYEFFDRHLRPSVHESRGERSLSLRQHASFAQ